MCPQAPQSDHRPLCTRNPTPHPHQTDRHTDTVTDRHTHTHTASVTTEHLAAGEPGGADTQGRGGDARRLAPTPALLSDCEGEGPVRSRGTGLGPRSSAPLSSESQ